MRENLKTNDKVNPVADGSAATPEAVNRNSGSTDCSFSAFNPFTEFEGKTIERTEYLGGGLRLHFSDGTSGRIEFGVPTDKISIREMVAYQAKGLLVLSGGIRKAI